MRIATWNINGIKARIDTVRSWVEDARPDIACLQEIKSVDEAFPREYFEELGYNVAVHGQKGFNGVAVLSRLPIDEAIKGLPGEDGDDQARFLEVTVSTRGSALRVVSLYLPNGNPVDSDKFAYKHRWMRRLAAWAEDRLRLEEPLVLAGDYNVIPEPIDARFPEAWVNDALFRLETRQAYRAILNLGFTDALRACYEDGGRYTFWDYQGGAWQKDNGIRIDHLLLSPQAADRLLAADIDKRTRAWEKPSDHVPVWIELEV